MAKKITIGRSVLETITVALYENPIILFREYVQNSLDAHNKAIDEGENAVNNFHVTIDVNEQDKKIVIKDNGYGIATNEFAERMLGIGSSQKAADRTRYIGFRGIGRISGLAFCSKLIFRNKVANSNKIHECVWDGDKYRKILDGGTGGDLQSIIKKIVTIKENPAERNTKAKHYFEVILEGYTNEIKSMLENKNFKEKLIRMLPLKYDRKFKGANTIVSKYNSFMKNEDLKRFMVSVKYDGERLFKSYNDKFILGSSIVFWEVRGKKKQDGSLGDKIGLLWFTFEGHLKSQDNDEYYGILTRSKNVLMGVNDTFAQVADANKEYVTTFAQMAQALRGIYGELLINSQHLSDNSRRDWFLTDEHSRDLNNVITDFMRRLHQYRYCASKYFRKNASKTKEELKHALGELVDLKAHNIDYDRFSKKEEEPREKKDPAAKSFAEEDIPYKSQSMRKSYDILMKIIEAYFRKIRKRSVFLKLRAFIVTYFKKK